jgi:hypothetical protein
VPSGQESKREAAAHAFMEPLLIKGEVFRCKNQIGCAVAQQFAEHGEADEFTRLLLAKDLAEKEWYRLIQRRSGFKRSVVPQEIEDALSMAQGAMDEAADALFDCDFERAAKTDEISASIRTKTPAPALKPAIRMLTPRQPRTGPSLFKRRDNGGRNL